MATKNESREKESYIGHQKVTQQYIEYKEIMGLIHELSVENRNIADSETASAAALGDKPSKADESHHGNFDSGSIATQGQTNISVHGASLNSERRNSERDGKNSGPKKVTFECQTQK